MRSGGPVNEWKVVPLGADPVLLHRVPGEEKVYLGNPSIEVLPKGRIIAAVDHFGPGVKHLPGNKGQMAQSNHWLQGVILTSNDKGATWTARHEFPFGHARLFRDGESIYLIGHRGNIQIIKSVDGGETWNKPKDLTPRDEAGSRFVSSPANVFISDGKIYLIMMLKTDLKYRGDASNTLAPVVLRAQQGTNLMNANSWKVITSVPTFRDLVNPDDMGGFGIPFYDIPNPRHGKDVGNRRWAHRMGWREIHFVRIHDPDHVWYDPSPGALHLLAESNTHRSNAAILVKALEQPTGDIRVVPEKTPGGKDVMLVPCPGGNNRFDLLYDEESRLYWLVSNRIVDSMTRPDRLAEDRYGLPEHELHRLQLHFSKNLVDWSFAGYIDEGASPKEARSACAMSVRGNDLCVVCRYGEPSCKTAYHTKAVAYYLIEGFRQLVY